MRKVEETGIITKNYRYNIDENMYIETFIEIRDGIIEGKNVFIHNGDDIFEIDFNEVEDFENAFSDLNVWLSDEGAYK